MRLYGGSAHSSHIAFLGAGSVAVAYIEILEKALLNETNLELELAFLRARDAARRPGSASCSSRMTHRQRVADAK